MIEDVLSVKNLHKSYHDGEKLLHVLKGVDFAVRAGESAAIVGKSGSGKSTLLNLLGLLDRPGSGEIWVTGKNASRLGESGRTAFRANRIGFVFQNYHLLADFSVLENIMLGAAVGCGGGFSGANRRRAAVLLERIGLAARAKASPAQLSGGEQQRVAIARALMTEPVLLLCDEPTGNLDAATGEEVADWLWHVAREEGMSIVVVTHDQALASRAGRVLTLENGVLTSDATLRRPFSRGE